MGFSALLLAAAAVKIAIPAFEAERAPSVLILHGPEYYANAFDSLDCATGITVSKLGPVAHTLFTNCDGEPVCLSGIGKNIAVDFLLVGAHALAVHGLRAISTSSCERPRRTRSA